MPDLFHTSGPTTFGTPSSFSGRNYDYTKIYAPDKQGDEAKENARVWNVYLDEAENYDVDMIQGFRNIIDSLLVFASLFSAVVTTFVAQTSQALQPDNTQITASLLFENNELLRAAGNSTRISAVPAAPLGPGSQTCTSIDVWVNGLFFTSLALSLSTALLSVLVKQWIQAYTVIVPGSAKTRALIRHFRFQGLMKWRLGDIIESLPLILHSAVAIFLVGLALYVSQLSPPICGVVSIITALTFLFYFGTSMLPALFIACPYRIPFIFSLAQLLFFAFGAAKCASLHFWYRFTRKPSIVIWPEMPQRSLKMAEHNGVFSNLKSSLHACDSLNWIFHHSSNHSVKEIVVEAAGALLDEWHSSKYPMHYFSALVSRSDQNDLFPSAIVYSLLRLSEMASTSTMEEDLERNSWAKLISNVMKLSSSKSLFDKPITRLAENWREQIEGVLMHVYRVSVGRRCRALSRRLLMWGQPILQSAHGSQLLLYCAGRGDADDIRYLLDRGIGPKHLDANGWTALHFAAYHGNLDGIIALVEREPSLISVEANLPYPFTALEFALRRGHPDVVAYLLDRGADCPSNALHVAVQDWPLLWDMWGAVTTMVKHEQTWGVTEVKRTSSCIRLVEVLLDRGWDRTLKDVDGRSPIDIASSKALVEHLSSYQTVSLPSYS